MDNKVAKSLAKRFLDDVEGYSSDVYQDYKNIPTVGSGLSLRSPATVKALTEMGKEVADVNSLSDKDLSKVQDKVLNEKSKLISNLQKTDFPNANLNEAQKAALISLAYNSPQLLGPELRKNLNANDELETLKEIAIRSNKENKPGVAFRRLQEAELFGGPLGFQQMVDSMSEQDKNIINNTLNQTSNEERRMEMLNKYPQFSPSYQESENKRFSNIFKIGK